MKNLGLARNLLVALTGLLTTTTATAIAQGTIQMTGPTSLSETYDAWTVQCATRQLGEKSQRVCQMSQEQLQQGTRQRVLTFAIGKTAAGTTATLILPFGLLLSEGVRVQVAEDEVLRGTYRTCLPAGCVAEVDLSEEVIEKLEAGETATVSMTASSGQQVNTAVSLKGFRSAYRRLAELAGGAGIEGGDG